MLTHIGARRIAVLLSLVLLSAIIACTAASAQSLSAPDAVMAVSDGSFTYTVTFTYPLAGAYFGSTHYEGLINCDLDLWADGFCMNFFEGGTVMEFMVEGNLSDPGFDGRVRVYLDTCDVAYWGSVETVITHAVPAGEASWSTLKASYQR